MKRRYVLGGLALVLAVVLAAPVVGAPSLSKKIKKAISKEVAKQLANKTGPAGLAGPPGQTGPRGPSNSFIKTGTNPDLPSSSTEILKVTGSQVGSGTFAVTAKVRLEDQAAGNSNNGDVFCALVKHAVGDNEVDTSILEMGETEGGKVAQATMSLVANVQMTANAGPDPDELQLKCQGTTAGSNLKVDAVVRLIQVESSSAL